MSNFLPSSRLLIPAALAGLLALCVGMPAQAQQPDFQANIKLQEFGPDGLQTLGVDIDIHGDLMVAGAFRSDFLGTNSGAAAFYRRDDGDPRGWVFEELIYPDDLGDFSNFGSSVSLWGDTAVISAPIHDEVGPNSGSVYVYQHGASGWTLAQKLAPSNHREGDLFGIDVQIEGDRIVVGASRLFNVTDRAGAVHVFEREGGSFAEVAVLSGSDSLPLDSFGSSVLLMGDQLVVGAARADQLGTNAGAAYVFRRDGATWNEEDILLPFDAPIPAVMEFGSDLESDGETLVVGAPWEYADGTFDFAGAAYTFVRDGGRWVAEQRLQADNARFPDFFGENVAIQGDLLLAGAENGDAADFDSGSLYVFERQAGAWVQRQEIGAPDGGRSRVFGVGIEFDGDRAWVADPLAPPDSVGAIYGVERTDFVNVPPVADAGPSSTVECDLPGGARVTLDGSASSDANSTPGTNDDITGFRWRAQLGSDLEFVGDAELLSDVLLPAGVETFVSLTAVDRLGLIDFGGTFVTVVDTAPPSGEILAPRSGGCAGADQLPLRIETSFADACDPELGLGYRPDLRQTRTTAEEPGFLETFGTSLDQSGDWMVVGAPSFGAFFGVFGSVHVFQWDGQTWQPFQELSDPDPAQDGLYGRTVAINDRWLVVGAPNRDEGGFNTGSIFIYELTGDSWELVADFRGSFRSELGTSLVLDGDTILAGEPNQTRVTEYRWDGTIWRAVNSITNRRGTFGENMDLDGDLLAVGAPERDAIGSVQLYRRDGIFWRSAGSIRSGNGIQFLGGPVSLQGDTLVVGDEDYSGEADSSGAAYVFQRFPGTNVWLLKQILTPGDPIEFNRFGASVLVAGGQIFVGSSRDDSAGTGQGAVFVYEQENGAWSIKQQLLPGITAADFSGYGSAIAREGDRLVVGARFETFDGVDVAGSVYTLDLSGEAGLYSEHGDQSVSVFGFDGAGFRVTDTTEFTIDRIPPAVEVLGLPDGPNTLPLSLALGDVFTASDDDGASGDVTHEQLLWNGCVIVDGNDFGNGDGRLLDETILLTNEQLCDLAPACPRTGDGSALSLRGFDCGGNSGLAQIALPGSVEPTCDN
ncbi:hypothetical protein ABI59_13435 [Acidobacteria bacterium Mor1]|nr:hypothetical protein ABI59_13435 [Acidobacteria bacterium Mor1]